ncbi:TIGR02757 family protein [Lujinxingia sediminis]|uniref:TIGR02757 family protein n=1 Tax=Lujinxingia sediminis TaxID=2480984 RepID=A0ABY0CXX2_9DELT|nr:TIGR02757 family protein [Lujinxingia sediminis]RVU48742.1 TIGR02757 family protein [Lujinxingia sediminis]
MKNAPILKALLEETIAECDHLARRDHDPVGRVWEYENDDDREVAALFASSLAYGQVKVLRNAIVQALAPLGPHPAHTLRVTPLEDLVTRWPAFTYRMTRGEDLADLAVALGITLRREGSLQALYRARIPHDTDRPEDAGTLARAHHLQAASHFVQTLRQRRHRRELTRGFRYLLPDPADGSTCKRLHLFFRWMSRGPDGIDLGLWPSLAPHALVMPLDTHTSRLCRYLGLLSRKSLDARAAVEVSERLAALDPEDPLKYDFALCHLGIGRRCIHRRSEDHCPGCPIEDACTL